MSGSYIPYELPLDASMIDQNQFLDELIDATARLEVYKTKIRDSKLNSAWFMPTLQQKEALASSQVEGTQATLEGVFTNRVDPNTKDQNLNEVANYCRATVVGYKYLTVRDFSDDFFCEMHKELMNGNVRKPYTIGAYRLEQNYIGRNDASHAITFIPPEPDKVPTLMANLISYMNDPHDSYRPLVRAAIVHAQFETIHPFMDGNGRVGRILIPMYLFRQREIDIESFVISEALGRDRIRYYSLLNDVRFKNDWNEWIRFFLISVRTQCDKYIDIVSSINKLYERHLRIAKDLARSPKIEEIINVLYKYPVVTAKRIAEKTDIPMTSINRYLNLLVENRVLYSDNKSRNRVYYYYDLLDILR